MENYTPVAVTAAELKEMSEVVRLQEECGLDTAAELFEELEGRYIAKFNKYITDGPGYVGPMYLIVWGIPAVTMVVRDMQTGQLRIEEDCR